MSDIPVQTLKTKGSATPVDFSGLPGFIPSGKTDVNFQKLRVRYLKLDLDDLADIAELEKVETKAIRNEGVYVTYKKEFTFMDRMFMIIGFLEEIKE